MKRRYRTEYKHIKLRDILVPVWQRPLDGRRVSKMAEQYDISRAEPLHVSVRDDGSAWVIDGNHRRAAGVLADGPDGQSTIRCKTYYGLTAVDEPRLFVELNDDVAIRPLHAFLADLAAGAEDACAIQHAAKASGMQVSKSGSDLHCVAALRRLYKRGGKKLVALTLSVMVRAFGRDAATDGDVIAGLGAFLHAHGSAVDVDRLVSVLAKREGGVAKLIGDGRTRRALDGGQLAPNIAEQILAAYNKGRRSNPLPSLRKSDVA